MQENFFLKCLNPYFNGICSLMPDDNGEVNERVEVLILILMEYVL